MYCEMVVEDIYDITPLPPEVFCCTPSAAVYTDMPSQHEMTLQEALIAIGKISAEIEALG